MKKFTSFLAMSALAVSSAFAAVPAGYELAQEWKADAPMAITKDWNTILEVPSKAFNMVFEKSYFVFHFTDCGANPQAQIAVKLDDDAWTWTQLNDYGDITEGTFEMSMEEAVEYSEESAETLVSALNAHGMYVKGAMFSLTGIDTYNPVGEAPASPLDGYELTSTYILPQPIVADNWKSMFTIAPAAFKNLKETSIIRFVFSKCGAEGQAQFVYKADDAAWTWTELSDYEDFKGKDDYLLPMSAWADPAGAVAGMQAQGHGLILKGKDFTLEKLEIYNLEGSVEPEKEMKVTYTWEPGAPMVCDKAWSTEVNIPAAAFKTLTDAATIRFSFIDCTDGQIQIATKSADGSYTWTELNDYTDILNGSAEITVADGAKAAACTPAEITEMVSTNGIILKGKNFSLVKVEILNPEGTDVEIPEELVIVDTWTATTEMVIKSWSSTELEVPAAAFVKATEKSTFRLHFKDCAGGQVQVAYKADDADWTWTQINDYGDIADNQYEISVADGVKYSDNSAADVVAGLKAHGMYLKGQKFTFTSIDVLNPKDTSGVSDITAESAGIDWNAPVEIYTVSGLRVSEMLPGQLYIVRQGANVAKVVK